MKMPDQEAAEFSLMSSFIPAGQGARNVLTGYLAVNAEAGNVAGEPSADYGKLRLLEISSDTTVPGPGQMANIFSTNPDVANELNILARGGSSVVKGNLLALPVGGGMLYVQPVYVQAAGAGTSYPLLQRVIVGFGEKEVGFAATLDEALDDLFGGDSGADAGDKGSTPGTPTPTPTATPTPSATPNPGASATPTPTPSSTGTAATARADLESALAAANQAVLDGQKALAEGDFTKYGEAQDRLDKAIQDALDAEARLGE
jgi:uncharacterized protein